MKQKSSYQPFFVAILLIVTGALSPSNGLDDRIYKKPLELIISAFIILLFTSILYLLLNRNNIPKEIRRVTLIK